MKSERTHSMGIGYWVSTGVFALQMGFTAYAQLCLPQVGKVFTHLGFPDYFRVELSLLKMAGLVVLLLPMAPARLREWAYAGFAFTLGSALIAHLAVGDGPAAWLWAVGTFGLEAVSYGFFRRGNVVRAGTGEQAPSGSALLAA